LAASPSRRPAQPNESTALRQPCAAAADAPATTDCTRSFSAAWSGGGGAGVQRPGGGAVQVGPWRGSLPAAPPAGRGSWRWGRLWLACQRTRPPWCPSLLLRATGLTTAPQPSPLRVTFVTASLILATVDAVVSRAVEITPVCRSHSWIWGGGGGGGGGAGRGGSHERSGARGACTRGLLHCTSASTRQPSGAPPAPPRAPCSAPSICPRSARRASCGRRLRRGRRHARAPAPARRQT
jgi:hypothetical protein